MSDRFTDTEKWRDSWFCDINEKDKLFWLYLLDNCNHAGIWKVNWFFVNIFIKDYNFEIKNFGDRITILSEEKFFIKKFIFYQQKIKTLEELNPLNRVHKSILKILVLEGIIKPLASPLEAPGKPLARPYSVSVSKSQRQSKDIGREVLDKMSEWEREEKERLKNNELL